MTLPSQSASAGEDRNSDNWFRPAAGLIVAGALALRLASLGQLELFVDEGVNALTSLDENVRLAFDPVNRECFTAVKGQGAWLNGETIRTSGVTELSQAVIAASFSARVDFPSPEIDQFVAAVKETQGVRRTGSAALNLCYVAAGRFDAFWALSTKAWDVAAGVLLVEEAGGVVTRLDGGPFSLEAPHPVATASIALQRRFCDLLSSAAPVGERLK